MFPFLQVLNIISCSVYMLTNMSHPTAVGICSSLPPDPELDKLVWRPVEPWWSWYLIIFSPVTKPMCSLSQHKSEISFGEEIRDTMRCHAMSLFQVKVFSFSFVTVFNLFCNKRVKTSLCILSCEDCKCVWVWVLCAARLICMRMLVVQ